MERRKLRDARAAVAARAKPSDASGRGLDWIGTVVIMSNRHNTRSKPAQEQRRAQLARRIIATSTRSPHSLPPLLLVLVLVLVLVVLLLQLLFRNLVLALFLVLVLV